MPTPDHSAENAVDTPTGGIGHIEVPGVLSAADVSATVEAIADWQLPNGMIPWFPGGHADPWNHVEAAMALATGGLRAEAERAFDWLVGCQRPDGSWHQYYLADRVEQDKLDANVIAYIAPGAWHHWLLFGDRGFAEAIWPVVERAIDFVLDLQTPRGEILWARHADGTPWSFALLTGSSSICHSLRCAIALAELLGHERPDWELSAARLTHVVGNVPEAFAPKHRWAMDWYYPVLAGVVRGDAGHDRMAARRDNFVMEDRGLRCLSDRPSITPAETGTPSLSTNSWSDLPSSPGPGKTSLAPTMQAEYGRPQALTWNIGTTGRMQSRVDTLSASGMADAMVCRMVERWL